MGCSPYVWIFIFTSIQRLNVVPAEQTGAAGNASTTSCPSVCPDTLTQLASNLSAQASELSNGCHSAADNKRDGLLGEGYSELASAVRSIQGRLMECGLNSDDLRYFRCLQDISVEVRATLEDIGNNLTKIITDYAAELSEIDEEEARCLAAVVDRIKQEYDQAYAAYGDCVTTESDCSPSASSSSSPSSPSSPLSPSSPSAPSSPSSPSSSPSASSTSLALPKPSTTSPSGGWPTSTTQPEEEESSNIPPERETTTQPSSAGASDKFVAAIVDTVVLVIIALICK